MRLAEAAVGPERRDLEFLGSTDAAQFVRDAQRLAAAARHQVVAR